VSNGAAHADASAVQAAVAHDFMKSVWRRFLNAAIGLAILVVLWWIGGYALSANPATESFSDFGPIPTFKAIPAMWEAGKIQSAVVASGYRLGMGLLIAFAIGVPLGILMGRSKRFRELSNSPFQFLRMVSPLSWMPLAVLIFVAAWDHSIIFLIAIASVWPIAFATAAGLAKVDPAWFKVARNLGAKPWHMILTITIPAIAFDISTGTRLALGIAWVVLVPAELLGVTSGLGYAIKDARETLAYSELTAIVLVIGVIGWFLDSLVAMVIKRFNWHKGEA
jgi:NitT/TauT family transport system permease protein